MATFSQYNTFTCTDTTQADLCVDYVHNALLAVGLVQTSVAGQLAGTSAWTMTSADNELGFREYELNDSLSATQPLYLRVYFGVAGQGNTIAAYSFVIRRVQLFFEKDGSGDPDPAKLLLYPASFVSGSGSGPTAVSCLLHIHKRDGFLLFHGGVVTSANGGNRRLGTFIVRRTAEGAFLLCDQSRSMASSSSWAALGYSFMTHSGVTTPFIPSVNRPGANVVTSLLSSPRYFFPLVLNTGQGVEILDDLVVTANISYEHLTFMELVDEFSAPLAAYRILPSAIDASTTVTAGTPFADSVPWVIDTSSRTGFCLAYRL